LIPPDGTSRREYVDDPASEQHAVQVQDRNAEVLDEINLRIRQPKDGDEAGEVALDDARAGMGIMSRTFVDDQYISRLQFVNVLTDDKLLERLDVGPRNSQPPPYVKDQIALSFGVRGVGIDQLDNLDDEHQFLLHGQRLVDLPDDLHNPGPVVHELCSLFVQ